jgi:hypothetical protein
MSLWEDFCTQILHHSLFALCSFLNREFPDLWKGRGAPITWPSRSPNFVFFWTGSFLILKKEEGHKFPGPLVLLISCLSEQGVSWSLKRKKGTNSLAPSFSWFRIFVKREFPDPWKGRGAPIPWPPRSPNFTPLDIFFWGCVKGIFIAKMCKMRMSHLTESSELQAATNEMLASTWRENHLDVCCATVGFHTEIYWVDKEFNEVFFSFPWLHSPP